MTSPTPDEIYLSHVTAIATDLRRVAAKVEEIGKSIRKHPITGQSPSRTDAVYEIEAVIRTIPRLGHLWWFAIEADYANARLTPGQLLDRAAGHCTPPLGDLRADLPPEEEAVLLAEAALRGAGIIR